jgi:hypothetical protein
MLNIARTSIGTESRCGPMLPTRCEVSGATNTAAAASSASPVCAMKARCRAHGGIVLHAERWFGCSNN